MKTRRRARTGPLGRCRRTDAPARRCGRGRERIGAVLRALLAAACLVLPLRVEAQDVSLQEPLRTVTAVRIPDGESVRVDGVLDEPIWRMATPAADFRQREPDNGAPASERTEVRVVYDSNRLIIGATLYESAPDRLLGNQMQRDQSFDADDRFLVSVDPFQDGRSGYVFQTNPAGALSDALIDPASTSDIFGAGLNQSWDGIWTVQVRRGQLGWTVELELPFRTLNFNPGVTAWGINFQRTVRRKREESLWTGHERNQGLTRMSSAGRLTGLEKISQGIGLDVKPYVVGTLSSAPGRGATGVVSTGDVGVDLFYNLTPALRANVSVNTDFAETEVDERQVNLTRFPLFFQEKRDFFLQGSSYFDFARDPGQAITPFFSRRIGLDERGQPQRIDIGAKLTGQAGPFDIGVLQARTGEGTSATAGDDFSVVRVRGRAFQQSYVGMLYTRRDARDAGVADRHTIGADATLRTSTFRGRQNLELSGFYLWTSHAQQGAGESSAYGVQVRYPNDPFRANMAFREIQPLYTPAVGFLQRVGYRRWNPDVGYRWRPASRWIRDFDFELDVAVFTDLDGRVLTREVDVTPLSVTFHDGSSAEASISREYERLEEDFEISDGVVLPAGAIYEFTRYSIEGSTAGHRMVSVSAEVDVGRFFSGRRRGYTVGVGVRPRPGVALTLDAERNVLDLAEGSFDTDVIRVRANTQFSPWVSIANDLQYDSVSGLLGWQLRFRWTQRPGNDLFFVYVHNWQEFGDPGVRRFGTLDSRAASKLVYTLRF
jgi:hypothetical protein